MCMLCNQMSAKVASSEGGAATLLLLSEASYTRGRLPIACATCMAARQRLMCHMCVCVSTCVCTRKRRMAIAMAMDNYRCTELPGYLATVGTLEKVCELKAAIQKETSESIAF